MDYKGRMRYIPRLIEPAGKARLHRDIFMTLSKKMDKSIKKSTESEIKKACKVEPKIKANEFKKRADLNVLPEMILESVSTSLLNSQRLLWLKETEKVTVKSTTV